MNCSRVVVATAATVLGLVGARVDAQDDGKWVDIRNPQELRALFSDKTHRSRVWVAHYRSDGQAIQIFHGSSTRHPRTWTIQGDDQVCTTPEGGRPSCFRFQRNREDPTQVLALVERLGQHVTQLITVEDGIPEF